MFPEREKKRAQEKSGRVGKEEDKERKNMAFAFAVTIEHTDALTVTPVI